MNYKEKYNQALERARYYHSKDYMLINNAIENIFPELAESEDERTRKELIEQIAFITPNNDELDDECNVLPTYQKRIDKYRAWLEKQGEQKTADKNKQNFKVGDWIVNTHNRLIWQITCIRNSLYYLRDVNGNEGYETYDGLRDNYHLWSINDAKDGDVLVSSVGNPFIFSGKCDDIHFDNPIAYCGVTCENKFREGTGAHWTSKCGVAPATKEQRDLLFQKMKNAGYEWDADKKELKKIEPKTLNADKVIEWIRENIPIYGNYVMIDRFKKDFDL